MPVIERTPDEVLLLVCECGVVVGGSGRARCGRDRVANMKWNCPTRTMRVVAWEDVDDDEAANA